MLISKTTMAITSRILFIGLVGILLVDLINLASTQPYQGEDNREQTHDVLSRQGWSGEDEVQCLDGSFLHPATNTCVYCGCRCIEEIAEVDEVFCAQCKTAVIRCQRELQFYYPLTKTCLNCSSVCGEDKDPNFCNNVCPAERCCDVTEFYYPKKGVCIKCSSDAVCGPGGSATFCESNCKEFVLRMQKNNSGILTQSTTTNGLTNTETLENNGDKNCSSVTTPATAVSNGITRIILGIVLAVLICAIFTVLVFFKVGKDRRRSRRRLCNNVENALHMPHKPPGNDVQYEPKAEDYPLMENNGNAQSVEITKKDIPDSNSAVVTQSSSTSDQLETQSTVLEQLGARSINSDLSQQRDLVNLREDSPENKHLGKSGFQKNGCITDLKHNRIIDDLVKLRYLPTFSLRIPNILVEVDRVSIRYYKKNLDTEQTNQSSDDAQTKAASNSYSVNIEQLDDANRTEASSVFTEYDFMRDVSLIRDTVTKIVPDAEIVITKINMVPRFRLTAGLSSRLLQVDHCAIRNRIGCITVLLNDSSLENRSTNDYALTAGHNVKVGDIVDVISDDATRNQIGTVVETIYGNGDNNEHVDAALIRLEVNAIDELQLRPRFSINGHPHRLSQLSTESSQPGRVIIKAVDQPENDDTNMGYIKSIGMSILEDPSYPDRFKLVQVARYDKAGNHSGSLHCEGESGQLMTYQPMPERTGFVNPVVMLTGLYPEFDDEGNYLYDTSVGVDLHRVLGRLSATVGEQLQLSQ